MQMDENRLLKDLEITDKNLSEAMYRQSGTYAYYAGLYLTKYNEMERAKMNLEKVNSHLYKSIKLRLAQDGEKATEKSIESEILITKAYEDAKVAEITAKGEFEYFKNILESLKQKKDMLIQAATDRREELKRCNVNASNYSTNGFDTNTAALFGSASVEDAGIKVKEKIKKSKNVS